MTTTVECSPPEALISSRLENLCNEVRSIKTSLATSLQGQDSRGGDGGEKGAQFCAKLKSNKVVKYKVCLSVRAPTVCVTWQEPQLQEH